MTPSRPGRRPEAREAGRDCGYRHKLRTRDGRLPRASLVNHPRVSPRRNAPAEIAGRAREGRTRPCPASSGLTRIREGCETIPAGAKDNRPEDQPGILRSPAPGRGRRDEGGSRDADGDWGRPRPAFPARTTRTCGGALRPGATSTERASRRRSPHTVPRSGRGNHPHSHDRSAAARADEARTAKRRRRRPRPPPPGGRRCRRRVMEPMP